MPPNEVIPILDFGAQYAQLIARRVREKGVYSELVRPDIPAEQNSRSSIPKASFFPAAQAASTNPTHPDAIRRSSISASRSWGSATACNLGCEILGGKVKPAKAREFGRAKLHVVADDPLVRGLPEDTTVWMSHGDQVHELPDGFRRPGDDADLSIRRRSARDAPVLRRAVPSRSHAHPARRADLPELPLRHLQMLRHLDDGQLHRAGHRDRFASRSATAR